MNSPLTRCFIAVLQILFFRFLLLVWVTDYRKIKTAQNLLLLHSAIAGVPLASLPILHRNRSPSLSKKIQTILVNPGHPVLLTSPLLYYHQNTDLFQHFQNKQIQELISACRHEPSNELYITVTSYALIAFMLFKGVLCCFYHQSWQNFFLLCCIYVYSQQALFAGCKTNCHMAIIKIPRP